MLEGKKLKVLWICNFSNSFVREHLEIKSSLIELLARRINRSDTNIAHSDYGQWITNALEELEAYKDIEFHIVSPHYGVRWKTQSFERNGIHYHFYPDESFTTLWKLWDKLGLKNNCLYKENRRRISGIIKDIQPDLVQVIGAENINYSLVSLDIPHTIPLIVQLQTLMNDPKVLASFPKSGERMRRGECKVLLRADYIGTIGKTMIDLIRKRIKPNAVFLANKLAVGVTIDKSECDKEYDFVYFASDISKSADLAIESFAIVKQLHPEIKLDIVGFYSTSYKEKLDRIITNNNIKESVFFEGRLPSYKDVLKQVKKSRFALLPLRPDILPSTIRESMALGCPVVTTMTVGTLTMNQSRESLLICEPENPRDIAEKMCLLLDNAQYADKLRKNSYETIAEKYDNASIIKKMVDSYYACYDHFHNNIPIPQEFLS